MDGAGGRPLCLRSGGGPAQQIAGIIRSRCVIAYRQAGGPRISRGLCKITRRVGYPTDDHAALPLLCSQGGAQQGPASNCCALSELGRERGWA